MREECEVKIKKLKLSLKNVNTRIEQECRRLREETVRISYVNPQVWNDKHQEAEIATKCAQHRKERFEALKKESLRWINEKKHLNRLLDTYEKSINIL